MNIIMASLKPTLVLAFLITSTLITTSTLMAQQNETVTPLISKDLADVSGKEIEMYTVDFPPGYASPVHRHNAQVFLYVLEGSIVTQVKGGKEVTLTPGQSYYEDPNDIHTVSRNASSTKPAKFLVFLIKEKGAPSLVLEK
jgi:quercetin dioxygenase-like cupin family protein